MWKLKGERKKAWHIEAGGQCQCVWDLALRKGGRMVKDRMEKWMEIAHEGFNKLYYEVWTWTFYSKVNGTMLWTNVCLADHTGGQWINGKDILWGWQVNKWFWWSRQRLSWLGGKRHEQKESDSQDFQEVNYRELGDWMGSERGKREGEGRDDGF